jgi:DNA-directed RNA polymerase subunit RPC12/RpoP
MKLERSSAAVTERRRLMTLSSESCEACRRQLLKDRDSVPHARLMVVSSAPVVEAYGGGVETRYVCLDCGHTLIHSTGRFGKGWH